MYSKIIFPGKASQTLCREAQHAYYTTHYAHVKNYLLSLGPIDVIDSDTTEQGNRHNNNFIVLVDGKRVMFDYSDFTKSMVNFDQLHADVKYFKFHTTSNSPERCIPFPPMSFMDWNLYKRMESRVEYNPEGSIFYKCRIYGGAVERRTKVKKMLESYHNLIVNFNFVPQEAFFNSLNECRINVIVPGASNDMVDRSHLQSFAFGIPVITPKLETRLPFNEMFEPNIDYIECAPDYSDVIDLIERYKNDKAHLDFISQNCKNKFIKTCTPYNVGQWILENL